MTNNSKKILGNLVILQALILLCSSTSIAVDVNVLVCPEGCGILVSDQYISREVKKADPDLNLIPETTGGYLYNMLEVGLNSKRWKNSVFAVNDDTALRIGIIKQS
ncbi:MAG: hypothetical protein GY749_40580 [Desulfobacteraceae bacterium]|nr:hypothetical protein [Desulfobacteraceae bacterium]